MGKNVGFLRNFDQIRYQKVDAQELLEIREACASDAYFPETQAIHLDLGAYEEKLTQNEAQITEFNQTRQRALRMNLSDGKPQKFNVQQF